MQVNRMLDTSSNALRVERASMSLSKAELKSMYKQVVKEIIQEEKEHLKKQEEEKHNQYIEIADEFTFYDLLETEIDYENQSEYTHSYINLNIWQFPNDIQDYINNQFKDELANLNNEFKLLMEPVNKFVDELKKKREYKEITEFNLNKEVNKRLKQKKKVKEEIVTL